MMQDFDDIRAYEDQDVPEVFQRLLREPAFFTAVQFLHPDWDEQRIKDIFSSIRTIKEFQSGVIYNTVSAIIKNSVKTLTHEGVERVPHNDGCLFISNHRDIILDSAFLNKILHENGHETTQIAIGSNLLIYPWITDLVRLNRSFIVKRNLSRNEMIEASKKLSAYIRHALTERRSSVWIAQREGRAKDGNDRTHPGLLKMLNISGEGDFYENFRALNILPVSISYEYDPCDGLKTLELVGKADLVYKKSSEDDLRSMFTGLTGQKGRVHYSFGAVLDDELKEIGAIAAKNDQMKALADLMDEKIIGGYRLWPTNYIAYDLLHNDNKYAHEYAGSDKKDFQDYMHEKLKVVPDYTERAIRVFLEMYANPLVNKLEMKLQV